MLFVNNQQPQIFPLHVALQQLVGADQNVDLALAGLLQDLCLLFGAAETRQHLNAHRPVGKAVAEVIVVLLGQQGRRYQHSHLLVVLDREEGGAHRHFGFAEAHVAAHQTVHRQRLTHVAEHGIDRLGLVRGSFEREAIAEQLVLLFIVFKGITGLGRALGVDIQQLRRHVAHFLRRFLPRPRPGVTAELMQRRILLRAARVAADQMQGRHRDIKFGVVGIHQHQVLALDATGFEGGHSRVTAHAMLEMDNRLAGVQLRQVADQRVRVDGAAVVLTTARHALTQQIAFADQRQIVERINKAMLGGANHQIAPGAAGLVQTQDPLRRHFDAAEQLAQRFAAAFAFDREDHRAGKGFEEFTQVIQWGFILRLHREVRQRLIRQIGIGGFVRQVFGLELHARPAFQLAEQLVGA